MPDLMRVSTTELESFRLFQQPDQEWMTEADLLATIRGEFVPTPAVKLGAAWGKVLADPARYQTATGYACDGYEFPAGTMAPALRLMDPQGTYEAKASKQYGESLVVAVADQLSGVRLIEHKTTVGAFNFDKYARSYQWRFYLDIFEPVSVTYHVFLLAEGDDGTVGLRDIETFTFYPYAELHTDCAALVAAFEDYVRWRGLDGFLRERQRKALQRDEAAA